MTKRFGMNRNESISATLDRLIGRPEAERFREPEQEAPAATNEHDPLLPPIAYGDARLDQQRAEQEAAQERIRQALRPREEIDAERDAADVDRAVEALRAHREALEAERLAAFDAGEPALRFDGPPVPSSEQELKEEGFWTIEPLP